MNDEAINAAITLLRSNGFTVRMPEGVVRWMTPKELRGEVGSSGIWRRLHSRECPPFEARRGSTGRLVELRVTPELRAFLAQPKRPGKRLAFAEV